MAFLRIVLFLIASVGFCESIKWLSISSMKSKFVEPVDCPSSKEEKKGFGFVQYQSELCRRMIDLMPYIKTASDLTTSNCLKMFEKNRWNCSTVYKAPYLGQDLTKGTKEQAFVYALSAATIVHQVAKACAQGKLEYCSCGVGGTLIVNNENNNELPPAEDFYRWQGCSDNIVYGISVSREWADAPWKPKMRLSRDLGSGFLDEIDIINMEKEREKNKVVLEKSQATVLSENNRKDSMNQNNNNVGRETVAISGTKKCKCHGVSSSCHIQTCWNSLPPVEEIARKLKSKYLNAQQFASKSSHFLATSSASSDLVYIRPSSDYCELTHGRECNATDSTALDSCLNLCCDRGHHTMTVLHVEQCQCRYVHCCYVRCKKCTSPIDKSFCN